MEWHVQVGDSVNEDQVLAEVMTDKATVEIPSPVAGRILALGGQPGQVMAVGGELIRLEVEGAGNLAESGRGDAGRARRRHPGGTKETPVAPPKAAAEAPRALRDSEAPRQRRQPGERPLASPRCASAPATWASSCSSCRAAVPPDASSTRTSMPT